MATGVRVKVDTAGIGKLLHSNELRGELTRRMNRVLDQAKATAPVVSGDFKDSMHLEQATTDRAVVRVVADSPDAQWAEAHSGTLARALDAAGGS